MITGIGLDLVTVDRIENLQQTYPQFLERILTAEEQKLFYAKHKKTQVTFLAGRYAAKEAFSKAYGTGIGRQVGFHDITILNDSNGKPYIKASPFTGKNFITITHTDTVAAAQVILEK